MYAANSNPNNLQFYSGGYGAGAGGGAGASFPPPTGGAAPAYGGGSYYPESGFYGGGNVASGNMRSSAGYGSGANEVGLLAAFGTAPIGDEPPLLEELGINFEHIRTKSVSVLNPMKPIDKHIMDDSDLAGPLVFCLLFGAFLLLSGKVHFGYIYGLGALGCAGMYAILNLMSEGNIDGSQTASVLGYCLLPMVLLSSVSILLQLKGIIGLVLSVASILWCTYSASIMFVAVLQMKEQILLVAYPVGLLYACFALLTVF